MGQVHSTPVLTLLLILCDDLLKESLLFSRAKFSKFQMALAIKSACCGKSLRQACLILLYSNLVLYSFGLVGVFILENNSSYREYYEMNTSSLMDTLLVVIGCLVILATIFTIYQKEPSQLILIIATWYLLIQSAFVVIMMFLSNTESTSQNVSISALDKDEMHYLYSSSKHRNMSRSDEIFWINVISLVYLALELYSALVCHSYKEELRKRPVYRIPPGQSNILGPANVQFVAAPYPAQPHQYVGLPPQYPVQPAHNPDTPLQYCTQPAYNPNMPPMYPTLPVQNSHVYP